MINEDEIINNIFWKVVLVGDPGVGKTSLIRTYSNQKFESSYKKTVGADFTVKYIVNERYHLRSNLLVWDIAGDESLKWLRRSYFSGANGAIIVFDLTNRISFDNISKWITEIVQCCGKIPMVIFGNKKDLIDQIVVSFEEETQKSDELSITFFETSALKNINVDLGFTHLCEILMSTKV